MAYSPRRGKKDSKGETREANTKPSLKGTTSKGLSKESSPNGSASNSPREREPEAPKLVEVQAAPTNGPAAAPKSGPPLTFTPKENSLMYDRTLWIIMNLVGKQVEVQVKSGEVFEGVLHTACTEKGFGVVLKMARKKDPKQGEKKEPPSTRPIPVFIIYPQDFVQINAKEVSFDVRSEREFATDTDISSHGTFRERELQPWVPTEDVGSTVDLTLESRGKGNWDQFEVNKQLFGVQTSWDEKYYTTEIKKEGLTEDEWRARTREAARIASEIERSGKAAVSVNLHLAEERGIETEDLDEEMRYGAVIREPSTSAGPGSKYIPPARRQQQAKEGQEKEAPKEERLPTKPKEEQAPKQAAKEPAKEDKPPTKETDTQLPLTRLGSGELTRSSSSITSPTSPRSPRSPIMSPGKGDYSLISERLRLRQQLVNERLKNSAPVPEKSPKQESFNARNRSSPLVSPLIGDARSVNALSLEPSTPAIDESVYKDFYNFSLASKKQDSKKEKIEEFKSFSLSLEKTKLVPPKEESEKSPKSATASPTVPVRSPATGSPAAATKEPSKEPPKETTPKEPAPKEQATKEPAKEPPKETTPKEAPSSKEPVKETTKAPTKDSQAKASAPAPKATAPNTASPASKVTAPATKATPSGTTPAKVASPAPAKATASAPAPAQPSNATTQNAPSAPKEPASTPATAPPAKEKETPKLNPNAPVFKPMSASAPSFTPSSPSVPIPMVAQGPEFVYDQQYLFRGAPAPGMFAPMPFAPVPVAAYPHPGVRVMPGAPPPGAPPYAYPGAQPFTGYPGVVYPPGQPQRAKTYVPQQGPAGKAPPTTGGSPVSQGSPTPHYPQGYMQGQRMVQGYYPQYAPGQPMVHPGQALDVSAYQHPTRLAPAQFPIEGNPQKGKEEGFSKFQGVPNADNFHPSPTQSQKEEKKAKD